MGQNILGRTIENLSLQDIRRASFRVFVLLYCLLCPLILFYAFGYIIHPQQQKIVQTGLVSVASFPSGASIYLGPSRYAQRTPAVISELLPGRYNLRVSLISYRPWEKTFTITAGKAVLFDSILLLPKILTPGNVITQPFRDIIPLETTPPSCILVRGRTLKEHLLFNARKNDIELLSGVSPAMLEAKVLDMAVATDDPRIILTLSGRKGKQYVLVDTGEQTVTDISPVIIRPPDEFFMDTEDTSRIYFLSQDNISMVKPQTGALYPGYIPHTRGFGVKNRKLYILSEDGVLLRMDQDKTNPVLFFSGRSSHASIFDPRGFYRIYPLTPEIFAFLGPSGQLAINRLPYRICDRGCRGISFNDTQDQLLFWTKTEIAAVDFLSEDRQSHLFPDSPVIRYATKTGRDIRQCFWAYEGSHVLFRDSDNIFLAELLPQGKPQIEFLARARAGTNIYYTEETGTVYYLDPKKEGLQALKIWTGDSSTSSAPKEESPAAEKQDQKR
ncbi:MAG: PEGA domain-containing protein [Candidatus Omnitrophica bacterium]|nr:PEGA domain-containing protein [Candidatus Omnitrophota bacterium]